METTTKGAAATATEGKAAKRRWGSLIMNFLMYGGWLLVIGVILGIVVLVSVLSK
jgi:hypothetical protein